MTAIEIESAACAEGVGVDDPVKWLDRFGRRVRDRRGEPKTIRNTLATNDDEKMAEIRGIDAAAAAKGR